jgi:hypothetical protein
MRIGTLFLYTTLSCLLPACSPKKSIKKLTIAQSHLHPSPATPITPPINIWVHGTRFIRRPLFHSFFNSTPGLRLAKELAPDYYLRKIANILCSSNPNQFCLDTFYLFGWSGKLRAVVREEAAAILFRDLQKIIAEYEQRYAVKPFIRIITHSHGGSVALNLAKVTEKEGQAFAINELVLLACPVQESTRKYIENDLFDHTISLYSSLDMVQVLAPQVIYNAVRTKKGHLRSRLNWPLFSYRRFQEHPKLAQVKIKINGRALFHTEFTSRRFVSILPYIIQVMNTWQAHHSIPHSTHLLCVYTSPQASQVTQAVYEHVV